MLSHSQPLPETRSDFPRATSEVETSRQFEGARRSHAAGWLEGAAAILCSITINGLLSGGWHSGWSVGIGLLAFGTAWATFAAWRARGYESRWIRISGERVAWRDEWRRERVVPLSDVTLAGFETTYAFELRTPKGRLHVDRSFCGYDELLTRLRSELPLSESWPMHEARRSNTKAYRHGAAIKVLLTVLWLILALPIAPLVMMAVSYGEWISVLVLATPLLLCAGWIVGKFGLERIEMKEDRLRWIGPFGRERLNVPLGSIRGVVSVENQLFRGLIDTDEGPVPVFFTMSDADSLINEARRLGHARTAKIAARQDPSRVTTG